jgi:hypothetical protein
MALLPPEAFDGKDVGCIYIAARRSEASRVESILSEHAVDYVVDIEPFEASFLGIFKTERDGVGFYVLATQAEFCRKLLGDAGLTQGLVDHQEQREEPQ